VKPYNITYTGWLSFLIWFLPKQSLKKRVELGVQKGFVDFKSDKFEGKAVEINRPLALLARYSLVFIMVGLLLPKIYWSNIDFWHSTITSLVIAGATILHVMFREQTKSKWLIVLWIVVLVSFGAYYYFNPSRSSFMFFALSSIRNSLFWYFIFMSFFDLRAIRKRRFFIIRERKIIFYV